MINRWAQIDAQGNVSCVMMFELHGTETFSNDQGLTFAVIPEGVDQVNVIESYKWINNAWVNVGARPSKYHEWDGNAWVYNLAHSQHDKWTEIKKAREDAEHGGFSVGTDTYDSDPVSQSRIQGAVINAMRDSTLTIDWTLADNTVKTLTASEILDVGDALAVHVTTQHEKARYFRAQIEAATTQTELDAILWS